MLALPRAARAEHDQGLADPTPFSFSRRQATQYSRSPSRRQQASGGIQGDQQQDESITQYDARYGYGERHDSENSTGASGAVNAFPSRRADTFHKRAAGQWRDRVIQPVGGRSGTAEPRVNRRNHCRNAEEQEQERIHVERKEGMGTKRAPAPIERERGAATKDSAMNMMSDRAFRAMA